MEIVALRPRLVSFRATKFHGDNSASAHPPRQLKLELKQIIEVGLGASMASDGRLQALVKVDLKANATTPEGEAVGAEFSASYEGKFEYPENVREEQIASRFELEAYQYVLVAQVIPLAMTHFRRELQAMGLDARELSLGL